MPDQPPRAPLTPGAKIPALWFDARGCGPSDLALQVQDQDLGHPRIGATLGLRVRVNDAPDNRPIVYGAASELVDAGFMLHRDQVVALRDEFEAWLARHPTPPGVAKEE